MNLYHWAPTARRTTILQQGLVLYSDPVTHAGPEAYPYLCMSPRPSRAWGLSGDMEWVGEVESWDLWEVRLASGDEVHVRPFFGDEIEEIKVRNSIPADRVWYVATRSGLAAQ